MVALAPCMMAASQKMSLCEGSLSRICIDLQLALPRRIIRPLSPRLPFLADAPARQIASRDRDADIRKGRLGPVSVQCGRGAPQQFLTVFSACTGSPTHIASRNKSSSTLSAHPWDLSERRRMRSISALSALGALVIKLESLYNERRSACPSARTDICLRNLARRRSTCGRRNCRGATSKYHGIDNIPDYNKSRPGQGRTYMHLIPQSWSHLHILISVFPFFGLVIVLGFYLGGLRTAATGVDPNMPRFFLACWRCCLSRSISAATVRWRSCPSNSRFSKTLTRTHYVWGLAALVLLVMTGVVAWWELWRSRRTGIAYSKIQYIGWGGSRSSRSA